MNKSYYQDQGPIDIEKNFELLKKLQETKKAVEKEIHKRLVLQLSIRAVNKTMSEKDQNLLEQLYLDLRSINPELAFATIKAAASINNIYKKPKDVILNEAMLKQKLKLHNSKHKHQHHQTEMHDNTNHVNHSRSARVSLQRSTNHATNNQHFTNQNQF